MSSEQAEKKVWEEFDKTFEHFDRTMKYANDLFKEHRGRTVTINMSDRTHRIRFAGQGWQRFPLAWSFFKHTLALLFRGKCVLLFRETKTKQQDHASG